MVSYSGKATPRQIKDLARGRVITIELGQTKLTCSSDWLIDFDKGYQEKFGKEK